MKKVAIVILNWNGEKLLEQFLPSVIAYSNSDEVDIIVADNASSDNSVELIKSKYPFVKLIQIAENYGYAGGYNRALQQVEAEYFVLLNSDVEVTEQWLDPLVRYLDENKDVAAAQPKIKAYRDKTFFEYAGGAGGYIDKLGYPFCRGRVFGTLEKDKGQYDTIVDIFWASGACLFIRSKDFFESGTFDDTFFAHMEEIDLCWRLNIRGRRLVCIPQSVVYHVGGATLNEESPNKTFLNFRNNLLMLYKNLPDRYLNKIMRCRWWLDNLAALQFRLQGKPENAKAVSRAWKEFKKIKNNYIAVRTENQKQSQLPIHTIYPHSILVAYYLYNCKVFRKLKFSKK